MQRKVVKRRHSWKVFRTIKLSDSDGFCGFQKMPKKATSDAVMKMDKSGGIGCAFRPFFKYDTIS